MKKCLLFLLLFLGLYGCSVPTEFEVPEEAKAADQFARQFIANIYEGNIDSSLAEIGPEALNDQMKQLIVQLYRSGNSVQLDQYKVVGINGASFKGFTFYDLGYEYATGSGYMLFVASVKNIGRRLYVINFKSAVLPAPLSELTKFTLRHKTIKQYVFLLFMILIPLFVILSLIFLLRGRITVKRKIVWTLIILFLSFPSFYMNWETGDIGYFMFDFKFLALAVSRPNLYSAWMLFVNLPVGAILFWVRRSRLTYTDDDVKYQALAAEVDDC